MTIDRIDKRTILVSLGDEELRRYALCFDEGTAAVEEGLKSLLTTIGETCGLDPGGKSFLVEALPARSGCLLIISVRTVKRRRVYRIKRREASAVCVFFDADAMLDYFRADGGQSACAVYAYEGRYVLLPCGEPAENLGEYGELCPVSAAVRARVCEHGRLLRQVGVQRRHIGGRTVAVRDAARRDDGG